MTDSNGSQSQGRNRDYVVLERQERPERLILDTLSKAEIELDNGETQRLKAACADLAEKLFAEVARFPSRNGAHALSQAGRQYEAGITPPLVAVSERMFKPKSVTVMQDTKVKVG